MVKFKYICVTLSLAASLLLVTGSFFSSPAGGADKAQKGEVRTMILMETSLGNIKLELYPDKAPISVENFLSYIKDGFFDGTIYHRIIPNFMIQGGGFTKEMGKKETKPPIKNEADNGLLNDIGSIVMARTSDINSATSQFFINVSNNTFLNHGGRDFGYAVFGKVVEGMDVVNKIAAVKTGPGDVPLEPVVIEKVSVVE